MTWRQDEGTAAFLELAQACLDDFAPLAIQDHEEGDGWRVFFRSAHGRDEAARAIAARFGERLHGVSPVDVPDEEWARRSQALLMAVRVGRVVVAPPWTPEAARAGDADGNVTVVIEPSMGFGTGHHATTRLCLELLQRVPVRGRRVVDVGTGSGVLALAAWRLGAAEAVAIDCDPDALANAAENVRLNRAERAVAVIERDLGAAADEPGSVEPADIVLANLTASTLERYAPALDALVRPHGSLIVSGFAPGDLDGIARAFRRAAVARAVEDAWAAALFPVPGRSGFPQAAESCRPGRRMETVNGKSP